MKFGDDFDERLRPGDESEQLSRGYDAGERAITTMVRHTIDQFQAANQPLDPHKQKWAIFRREVHPAMDAKLLGLASETQNWMLMALILRGVELSVMQELSTIDNREDT
jgi:hypothetical protein